MEKLKEKIIEYICSIQVTEFDLYSRGEYGGYFIKDDECMLVVYSMLEKETGEPLKKLKETMKTMRNDGLVELMVAVDYDGNPSGSGWSITVKGLKYAVENKLITL